MDRGSYIAANGMIAQQQRLDVLANNLANVSTTGFKADRLTFGDMMRRTLADGAGTGDRIATLSSGPEADEKVQTTDMTEGGAVVTGNPLDARLGGRTTAMFEVRHGNDVRYTRDGAFTLDVKGNLVTHSGDAVLDEGGQPITGISGKVAIGDGGAILVGGKTVARLGLAVGAFKKDSTGDGLYDGTGIRAASPQDGVQVASNALETSNVNPVRSMIDLIAIQRSYEIAQKMVQSQDDSSAKLADTMS